MVPAAEIYGKPVPGWESQKGQGLRGDCDVVPARGLCILGWCWRAPCVCLAFVMSVFLLFSQVLAPVTLTIGMVVMGLTGSMKRRNTDMSVQRDAMYCTVHSFSHQLCTLRTYNTCFQAHKPTETTLDHIERINGKLKHRNFMESIDKIAHFISKYYRIRIQEDEPEQAKCTTDESIRSEPLQYHPGSDCDVAFSCFFFNLLDVSYVPKLTKIHSQCPEYAYQLYTLYVKTK